MKTNYEENISEIKRWLTNDVYPLWSTAGVQQQYGGFVESLSFQGQDLALPRRAMVQSRQIYSFLTGARMQCFPKTESHTLVKKGTHYLNEKFSVANGSFRYSIENNGAPKNEMPDLYTQAFALFGLAQEYSVSQDPVIKERAKKLESYLRRERQGKSIGFTEVDEQGTLSYKSNPHMHLFEAAIAWMQIDSDPCWKDLGAELIELCLNHFIIPSAGVIAEYFDEDWNVLTEDNRFIYEPGHQFEWAWLMALYEELTGKNLKNIRHAIFLSANEKGTNPNRRIAYDEMWSDFTPKKITSRFWPQCERIKAAVRLGAEVSTTDQALYAKAADEALETLFKFLQTPHPGMWYDQLSEKDTFSGDLSKSSSLYHIINAMEEYVNFRPRLKT